MPRFFRQRNGHIGHNHHRPARVSPGGSSSGQQVLRHRPSTTTRLTSVVAGAVLFSAALLTSVRWSMVRLKLPHQLEHAGEVVGPDPCPTSAGGQLPQ
jgi:hypothetical protein